jgi:hypothetical protein
MRPPRRAADREGDGLSLPERRIARRPEKGERTNLSNPPELSQEDVPSFQQADGGALRRRYALFCGMGILVVWAVVGVVQLRLRPDAESGNAVNANGFELESTVSLEEMGVQTSIIYKHTKSGTKVMTMIPTDSTQDATFGISFRTQATNNHGTARVVEQAIKLGSETYPIKDPLNQLEHGSLQTYLGSTLEKDRTQFILSSRNAQDFSNSMKVYLDALFKPNMIKPENGWTFRQEGWRLQVNSDKMVFVNGYVCQRVVRDSKRYKTNGSCDSYYIVTLFLPLFFLFYKVTRTIKPR